MDKKHIQGTPEWLAHRRNHIGASDAAAVLGESIWTTPYQLWEDKMGISPPKKSNAAMARGTALEPDARKAFEESSGVEMFPEVVYHDKHPFMMASLDGLSLDGKSAVEIKCPGQKSHTMALRGNVPSYYVPQLQHQLACLGLERMWYYSFDGCSGVSLKVYRDEKYIKRMIEEETKFWDRVQTFNPPEFTDRDYDTRDDIAWLSTCKKLMSIDREISDMKEERERLKQSMIDGAKGRSCRGGGFSLSRCFPKGRIDYGAVPELDGVDLDKYRKLPKEQWTLRSTK